VTLAILVLSHKYRRKYRGIVGIAQRCHCCHFRRSFMP